MSDDRSFSSREIAAFGIYGVLAALIGIGAYQIGYYRISGNHAGGAAMVATQGQPPVNGQTLYASNCAACHGATAGGGIGPNLKAAAAWSEADFKSAVLNGQAPGGRQLKVPMPQFAKQGLDGAPATDEQVKAIHDYLASLK